VMGWLEAIAIVLITLFVWNALFFWWLRKR
jgi:hypothetical protein